MQVLPVDDDVRTSTPFCRACGNGQLSVLYRNCATRRGPCRLQFDLLQCQACRIVFLFPLPSEALLTAIYSQDYHSHINMSPTSNCLFRAIRSVCLWPYRLRYGSETTTFKPFRQGRLLDVGCGAGDYLAAMSSLGWECSGIDVSEAALN